MNANTGRESDKFMLRFPEGMRDLIKARADENGRSMNSEIIELINSAMDQHSKIWGENAELVYAQRSLVKNLLSQNKEWAALYREQVQSKQDFIALLTSLCHLTLSHGESVPSQISDLARDILSSTNRISHDATESPATNGVAEVLPVPNVANALKNRKS